MSYGTKLKFRAVCLASFLIAVCSVFSDIIMQSDLSISSEATKSWLGWSVCRCFLCGLIAAQVLKPDVDASLFLVSLSLSFFTFWTSNLFRIIISILSLPVVAVVSRRAEIDPNFENPLLICLLSISVSGFFNSVSEGSANASQRAVKKYSLKDLDSVFFIPGAHEFFVEYSLAFFLYSIISVCKIRWTLLNELTLFLINCFAALPFAYQMARKEKLAHFYTSFLISNVVLAGWNLPLKLIARASHIFIVRLQGFMLPQVRPNIPPNEAGFEMNGLADPENEQIDPERNAHPAQINLHDPDQ